MRPLRFLAACTVLSLLVPLALAQHNKRPPRIYDLQNVTYRLSFDETLGTIDGEVTNTVVPLKPGLKEVWFDSDKLNIKEATVNGKAAKFVVGNERVTVTLPKVSSPADKLAVRLVYNGRPEAGIYFIPAARAFPAHTSVVYTQGEMIDTRYWIPTYDWPDDKATFDAYIKVPTNYLVISNGKMIDETPTGNMKVVHYQQAQPMSTYLMSLVTGQYTRGEDGHFGTTPVRWNVPVGLEDMGKAAFGGTDKMIDVYSKVTGFPYPYAKFDQSAVPDYMFGGMENITAVTQTIDALFPSSTAPVNSSEGLVLHELAHQWFGDTVTCPSWEHAWINEGWATFLPHFYVRAAHGQEDYDMDRYGTLQGGYFSTIGEKRPVVWTGYQEPIDEFSGSIYPGGATRMFWLMYNLGEEKFWKTVKGYLETYKYKNVTTEQFFDYFSKTNGVNLDTFRKQWFYTAAMPDITVKRTGTDLVINQKAPYFDLNLPVWILNGTKWEKKKIFTNSASVKLPLGNLAGKPLLVDPEVYLAAGITYDFPIASDEYMAIYRNAPNAAAKLRLDDTMLGKLNETQIESLADAEKNIRLLERIIPSIKNEAYLLTLTRHADPRIVNTAASVFGGNLSEAVRTRLQELMDNPNIMIQQTAMRTLLNSSKDDALAAKAWTMPSYNEGFRGMAFDYYQRNDKDKARELALGVLANPDSEDLRRICIRALGELKDKPGDRRAFDALVKVVQERSFGARTDAMNALANYGDKSAIRYLQPITTNSLHFMRRSAQGAVARLGG